MGTAAPFDRLLSLVPEEGETGPGWDCSARSRLGRLALRLWALLLDHEQLTAS